MLRYRYMGHRDRRGETGERDERGLVIRKGWVNIYIEVLPKAENILEGRGP